jgi:putative endonuclease
MSLLDKIFTKKQIIEEQQSKNADNPKKDNTKTGQLGESLAQEYLKKKGYRIIDVNYKTKFYEIDIIAQFEGILVFVEVRTRVGDNFGIPEQSLIRKKVNKVIKNAQMYMKYKGYTDRYRIDAVCVVLDKNKNLLRLNHYENITI